MLFLGALLVIAVVITGHGPSIGTQVWTEVQFCGDVVAHRNDETGVVTLTFIEQSDMPLRYDSALTDRIRDLENGEVIRVTYFRQRTGVVVRGDTTWVKPTTYEVVALDCLYPLP
jgi:hypothetical protein